MSNTKKEHDNCYERNKQRWLAINRQYYTYKDELDSIIKEYKGKQKPLIIKQRIEYLYKKLEKYKDLVEE